MFRSNKVPRPPFQGRYKSELLVTPHVCPFPFERRLRNSTGFQSSSGFTTTERKNSSNFVVAATGGTRDVKMFA